MLSRDEITRYSRNILLPEVRKSGQEKLKSSSVLVVGAGGIGSPVLTYLAASGIGRIRCVDSDHLDLTNLQRQVLYRTGGVGSPKIDLAREQIHSLNPNLELDFRMERFSDKNAKDLVTGMDLVIETSDNFPTKFLVSDVCVENR
ncbi:MAG TPA: HesA/MoeB/ThiF family protein, partial [Leptospiraceae bacterium]|nr:HesA/MoeB/ThiF family protein [Leptospiraceae bacterium]